MTGAGERFDVIVLGAGMAGATLAAHLAPERRVLVLERDAPAGLHATGRSSAMLMPSYGGPPARPLTRASLAFFTDPPCGFERPLVRPRPALHVATASQTTGLERLAAEVAGGRLLGGAEAAARTPLLRPGRVAGALLEPTGGDIDVHGLHQGFLKACREAGGEVRVGLGEPRIERSGAAWRVRAGGAVFTAPVLANAAGPWADEVAAAAGVARLGLRPLRRTVILTEAPEPGAEDWPTVKDIDEQFYFRPSSGRLLFTACEETPSPACDAQPETEEVARAAHGLQRLSGRPGLHPVRSWAGLRTFTADRAPAIGWADEPGFFWMAGLGGFGIQTAPATGPMAAALLLGRPIPAGLADHGVDAAVYAPTRFRSAAA